MHEEHHYPATAIALDYIDTVNANIALFLKDKTYKIDVSIETVSTDFAAFWELIGAEGNIDRALDEWKINYNAS